MIQSSLRCYLFAKVSENNTLRTLRVQIPSKKVLNPWNHPKTTSQEVFYPFWTLRDRELPWLSSCHPLMPASSPTVYSIPFHKTQPRLHFCCQSLQRLENSKQPRFWYFNIMGGKRIPLKSASCQHQFVHLPKTVSKFEKNILAVPVLLKRRTCLSKWQSMTFRNSCKIGHYCHGPHGAPFGHFEQPSLRGCDVFKAIAPGSGQIENSVDKAALLWMILCACTVLPRYRWFLEGS